MILKNHRNKNKGLRNILRSLFFVVLFSFMGCFSVKPLSNPHLSPSPSRDQGNESDEIDDLSNQSHRPFLIVAINVGQGDATLLVTPSQKTILIDGGPPGSGANDILPLLSQLGIYHLDTLFISHYDADHVGGVPEIVAGADGKLDTEDDILLENVFDRGRFTEKNNEFVDDYFELVDGISSTPSPGEIIDFGDGVTIECIIINGILLDGQEVELEPEDENGHSMALLIQYENFRYFTAGDLPGGGLSGSKEQINLEKHVAPLVGQVDILHVSHHGSETSTTPYFLKELSPTIALISTGNDNNYGHPDPLVLSRLNQAGSIVYQTEEGDGGYLPTAHVANDSIFIFVENDGKYEVNGDEYQAK